MNEPDFSFFQWVAGGVATVLAWVMRRQVHRMDEQESRISNLERSAIDDEKLERTITRIEAKIDLTQTIVRTEIGELHRRIDDAVRPR